VGQPGHRHLDVLAGRELEAGRVIDAQSYPPDVVGKRLDRVDDGHDFLDVLSGLWGARTVSCALTCSVLVCVDVPCQNPACCPDLLVYARRSCSSVSSTCSWSGCSPGAGGRREGCGDPRAAA